MNQSDAVSLGYEMNAALGAYLDAWSLTEADKEKAKEELLQLFWNDKAGIISYLLGTRAGSYAKGIEDANEMVGALWSDLFNKDLVKAAGAEYFDRWRARIKELAVSSGKGK